MKAFITIGPVAVGLHEPEITGETYPHMVWTYAIVNADGTIEHFGKTTQFVAYTATAQLLRTSITAQLVDMFPALNGLLDVVFLGDLI